MKKTLHLNLKRKWFDMIKSGVKKEEYREIKESMISILFDWREVNGLDRESFVREFNQIENKSELFFFLKNFDTITFSNGYSKNRPQFEISFDDIEVGQGKKEWGAEEGTKCFVLKLGNIIE